MYFYEQLGIHLLNLYSTTLRKAIRTFLSLHIQILINILCLLMHYSFYLNIVFDNVAN